MVGGEEPGAFMDRFVVALECAPAEELACHTGFGLAHRDLHGGNVLVDAAQNIWLIVFATMAHSHSLEDLGKLCSRQPTIEF